MRAWRSRLLQSALTTVLICTSIGLLGANMDMTTAAAGLTDTTDTTTTSADIINDTMDMPMASAAAASAMAMDMTASTDMAGMDMTDHMHGDMAHPELYNLVLHEDATHTAVNSGSWFDPATWAHGNIPDEGARVVIPIGVEVTYDEVSDARLFTVRVDGELNFATDTNSTMIVDTLVVDDTGMLLAGTKEHPVEAGVDVKIIIANNGAIDIDWDPTLLSRGIVAMGHVEMHGQEKISHLKVETDPMAGDKSISLSGIPEGWQVGDTIVIGATHYDGYAWEGGEMAFQGHEDEVVTITEIDGTTVRFDTELQFDHDSPRDDLKASVANYSRNVSIGSEDGADSEIFERGHVMFMHNDDVDVRYVEFFELGRTDKTELAQNDFEFDNIESDSNVKGRYALHIHRAGVDDIQDPAVLEGNAVFGSPGWGIVQHDSNAIIDGNATYNTIGAGFVAETGNETGTWSNNIAIFAKGSSWESPKTGNDPQHFDNGKTGEGFFFQGRMVDAIDNIAVSTNTGFSYWHRARSVEEGSNLDTTIKFDPSLFEFPDALQARDDVAVDDAPIRSFDGNEVIASQFGLYIQKSNPNQGHDVHSVLSDFTAWEVVNGAQVAYTSHYLLQNFDLIGKADMPDDSKFIAHGQTGIIVGKNASDVTIVDAVIQGFDEGFDIANHFVEASEEGSQNHLVVNPTLIDVGKNYAEWDPSKFTVLATEDLVADRFEIDFDKPLFYEGVAGKGGRIVDIDGTKTDSAGTINLPSGTDNYDATYREVMHILKEDGYFSGPDGKNYFILKDYYTDRVSGEVFKFGQLVRIGDNVPLGDPNRAYADAKYNGEIDFNNRAPVVQNESVSTHMLQPVTVNLLANDTDPEGDDLYLDGIVQPLYGRVIDNGNGTITYTPYLNYDKDETVKYWVTDKFGNFSEGFVNFDVMEGTASGETAPPPPVGHGDGHVDQVPPTDVDTNTDPGTEGMPDTEEPANDTANDNGGVTPPPAVEVPVEEEDTATDTGAVTPPPAGEVPVEEEDTATDNGAVTPPPIVPRPVEEEPEIHEVNDFENMWYGRDWGGSKVGKVMKLFDRAFGEAGNGSVDDDLSPRSTAAVEEMNLNLNKILQVKHTVDPEGLDESKDFFYEAFGKQVGKAGSGKINKLFHLLDGVTGGDLSDPDADTFDVDIAPKSVRALERLNHKMGKMMKGHHQGDNEKTETHGQDSDAADRPVNMFSKLSLDLEELLTFSDTYPSHEDYDDEDDQPLMEAWI